MQKIIRLVASLDHVGAGVWEGILPYYWHII